MLARTRGRDHMVGVHGRGRQDLDGVDVVVGEERVERLVQTLDAPLLRASGEHLGPGVAQRDQVAPLVGDVARHIERGDVADTDDSHPDAVHVLAPLKRGT